MTYQFDLCILKKRIPKRYVNHYFWEHHDRSHEPAYLETNGIDKYGDYINNHLSVDVDIKFKNRLEGINITALIRASISDIENIVRDWVYICEDEGVHNLKLGEWSNTTIRRELIVNNYSNLTLNAIKDYLYTEFKDLPLISINHLSLVQRADWVISHWGKDAIDRQELESKLSPLSYELRIVGVKLRTTIGNDFEYIENPAALQLSEEKEYHIIYEVVFEFEGEQLAAKYHLLTPNMAIDFYNDHFRRHPELVFDKIPFILFVPSMYTHREASAYIFRYKNAQVYSKTSLKLFMARRFEVEVEEWRTCRKAHLYDEDMGFPIYKLGSVEIED